MEEQKEQKINLMQKLAKIRNIADAVVKSLKGFNYTYADITDILAKVKAGMAKYGVSLIPYVIPATTTVTKEAIVNTKVAKTGEPYDQTATEYLIKADMVFDWVDDESGEKISVPWVLVGAQSDPSQAFGSGMTYVTRYFLTDYFQIAQVKTDVDEYRSKQKESAESEDRAIAESLIGDFDAALRLYLADNPDKAEEIKAFTARYAKNSNYKAIKDPALAAKLVEDFKKNYGGAKKDDKKPSTKEKEQ